jgi:acyl-CoA thioesterase-1
MLRYIIVGPRYFTIVLFIFCILSFSLTVRAENIKIVALGASNTVGRAGTSYPVELETMLKAKGYDAQVVNAGRDGDTTAGMLSRLDAAVPNGTRLVLLNPANLNDAKAGIRTQQGEYVAQITSRLNARNIKIIVLPSFISIGVQHIPGDDEHFTADGYRTVAAWVLPQVIAAIGSPGK